jgi:hypothetical protein
VPLSSQGAESLARQRLGVVWLWMASSRGLIDIALYNASPPLLSLCHSGHVAKLLAHCFDHRGDADITVVFQYLKIRREYRQSRFYVAKR